MICQGCGQEVEPNEKHTYQDCLDHVMAHPEDREKVTLKHLYTEIPDETEKLIDAIKDDIREVIWQANQDGVEDGYEDMYEMYHEEYIEPFRKWLNSQPETVNREEVQKKFTELFGEPRTKKISIVPKQSETEEILADKELMKKIRKARKNGGSSSPYKPLTEKGEGKT